MKVAITGASGFIGKHVLRVLQAQNVEVVAITRHAEKLSDFVSPFCSIVEMDIANFEPYCFKKLGCPDMLIHLAWDGLPNYKSLHHFEIELPKHYEFLKSLIDDGLPKLIVTGTCFE